ncbi:hypothetical protein AVEN_197138-1 [Araneus ventricosus]|uniref:Uncharacterized protein n=1 Tax=Araneus ventricosus TaxID=182803 RepID=A0A4Y2BXD9_ARAVE|nr:hypothetical protein AVEN_7098-1 [Araneus ventricosus]GBL95820.1 hypothetical protein AVEN_197138-1 [Araneus ventricosus]
MDLVILNCVQMTRTTPELVPPLKASAQHQREGVWTLSMGWRAAGPIRGGSSVELGFEPATLRSRGRGLATRPLKPQSIAGGGHNRMPLLA